MTALLRCAVLIAIVLVGAKPVLAREPVTASVAAASIEVYFTPWDDAQGALVSAIEQAQQQVLVQAFLLTSRTIAASLVRAYRRGVDVKVLADQRQHTELSGYSAGSQLDRLARAGIPVWLETRYRSAHNKVMLIDVQTLRSIVITGSYNFSRGAQSMNAENLLLIRGNTTLAQRFEANWLRHQSEATLMEIR